LSVSLGAAVAEEVWFRLGLMTLMVWGVVRLLKVQKARPIVDCQSSSPLPLHLVWLTFHS
jgi:hypothetical protein